MFFYSFSYFYSLRERILLYEQLIKFSTVIKYCILFRLINFLVGTYFKYLRTYEFLRAHQHLAFYWFFFRAYIFKHWTTIKVHFT